MLVLAVEEGDATVIQTGELQLPHLTSFTVHTAASDAHVNVALHCVE